MERINPIDLYGKLQFAIMALEVVPNSNFQFKSGNPVTKYCLCSANIYFPAYLLKILKKSDICTGNNGGYTG